MSPAARRSRAPAEVVVVGAGVCGLSTAVRLAERGIRVLIRTGCRPRESSSAAAGAIWDPAQAHHPSVPVWSTRTYAELHRMQPHARSGVHLVAGIEAARTPLPPDGIRHLPGFRPCTRRELPDGFVVGWRYLAPVIDMPVYLDHLLHRVLSHGSEVVTGRLRTLHEAFRDAPIVINCSGSGARELVPDAAMEPVRGQLVVVRNPGVREFFIERTDVHEPGELSEVTYLLPQGDLLLLGGNAEPGVAAPTADADVARRIRQRCIAINPAVATAEVLGDRVGIRPGRPQVRLEHVDFGNHHVIHNYGHGGSGVSVSWGCADEIAELVGGLLDRPAHP